jgi:two-component system, OmpR family, response regulator BaeR
VSEKCRVLCVDDHTDTGEMLEFLLKNSEFEVETAYSVQDALQAARCREFDLYVIDKRFPDGDGIELCRELRKLTPETPIIIYTADAYKVHRDEGIAAGADAYVPKPYIEDLLAKVNALLAGAQCASSLG